MKEIMLYISDDKIFTSKRACKEYEQGTPTPLPLFNYLSSMNFSQSPIDVVLRIKHSNEEYEEKIFEHWDYLLDYIEEIETKKVLWEKKIIELDLMNINADIDFNDEPFFIVELEISIHDDN